MKKTLILLMLSISSFSHGQGTIPYLNLFSEASEKYQVPLAAILAVAHLSSGFKPNLETDNKLCGLMQISYQNEALWSGDLNCFDPKTNINLGVMEFSKIYESTNQDVIKTIKHYRRGYFPELTKIPLSEFELQWDKDITQLYEYYSKELR